MKNTLKPYNNKQRLNYYSSILLSIFGTVMSLAIPMIVKRLLDSGQVNIKQILIVIGAFLLATIIASAGFYFMLLFGVNQMNAYRNALLDHLYRMSMSHYDQIVSAEIANEILLSTQKMEAFISQKLAAIFPNTMMIIGALIILFYTDWKLSCLIFVMLPLLSLVIVPISNVFGKLNLQLNEQINKIVGQVTNYLQRIKLVKASVAEDELARDTQLQMQSLRNNSASVGRINAIMQPSVTIFLILIVALIFGYGGYRVQTGTLTIGTLIAFLIYLFQLLTPLTSINGYFASRAEYKQLENKLNRVFDYSLESTAGTVLEEPIHTVKLSGVDFGYGEAQILHDIDMTIRRGEKVAIVGPSGSGKSTLFNLLMKFYEPNHGSIMVNQYDLHSIQPASWRDKTAYVAQDNALIHGTIVENLTLGLERIPTSEQIENALKQAQLYNDVQAMEDGINTMVGEQGGLLSGGQKQRIQIARALLRQPELLLFDEATSSLDSETEHHLTRQIFEVFSDITTVMIAHRLSTIVHADTIYFLEGGQITGVGTHDELMASHAKYQEYVQYQTIPS